MTVWIFILGLAVWYLYDDLAKLKKELSGRSEVETTKEMYTLLQPLIGKNITIYSESIFPIMQPFLASGSKAFEYRLDFKKLDTEWAQFELTDKKECKHDILIRLKDIESVNSYQIEEA